jgi:hypothetical protein
MGVGVGPESRLIASPYVFIYGLQDKGSVGSFTFFLTCQRDGACKHNIQQLQCLGNVHIPGCCADTRGNAKTENAWIFANFA